MPCVKIDKVIQRMKLLPLPHCDCGRRGRMEERHSGILGIYQYCRGTFVLFYHQSAPSGWVKTEYLHHNYIGLLKRQLGRNCLAGYTYTLLKISLT